MKNGRAHECYRIEGVMYFLLLVEEETDDYQILVGSNRYLRILYG